MKTQKQIACLWLCGALLGILPAAAQTLSLDECRAAAIEHNRTLASSRLELEQALQTRREAFTSYFPQIAASGGVFQAQHGLVQADFALSLPQMGAISMPLSLVKRGIMGSVTAVQPLFAGLKIVNGNKLARLGEEVGRLQLRKTEAEVREQTDAYFWQIVSIRENLATLDAVDRHLERPAACRTAAAGGGLKAADGRKRAQGGADASGSACRGRLEDVRHRGRRIR